MQYLIDYTETFANRFEVDAPAGMSEEDMWHWLDNHDMEYERSLSNCESVSSESVVIGFYDGYRIAYSDNGRRVDAYRWFESFHELEPSGWQQLHMSESCEYNPFNDPIAEAELINKLVMCYGVDPELVEVAGRAEH